jgi:hypothetical protein
MNLISNVQNDPRTRLVLITETHVAVQFNGPILQFSEDDPLLHESISRLGLDALKPLLAKLTILLVQYQESALEELAGW